MLRIKSIAKYAKYIPAITIILSAFFSSVALYQSCEREGRIEKLEHLNYRPLLSLAKGHSIKNIELDFLPTILKFTDFLKINTSQGDSILDVPMQTKFTVHSEFSVTNTGNNTAKIIAILSADSVTGYYVLRESFQEIIELSAFDTIHLFQDYFQSELLPDAVDTVRLEFSQVIGCESDNKITLHYLIIYQNELGNLYDTYFWFNYQLKELIFPSPFHFITDSTFILKTHPKPIAIARSDYIKIKASKPSYKIYSEEESDKILKFFEAAKQFNSKKEDIK